MLSLNLKQSQNIYFFLQKKLNSLNPTWMGNIFPVYKLYSHVTKKSQQIMSAYSFSFHKSFRKIHSPTMNNLPSYAVRFCSIWFSNACMTPSP